MARFSVRDIRCKSLINRVHGMPFAWSINPYRGCRHACVYCYARPTHQYLGLNGGEEFEEIIFAKVNAPEVARAELGRRTWQGENVVVGTATDPYQQAESSYRLTRGILEAFRDNRNPVSITTKSPMILRDLDVLADLVPYADVTVCMTITTLDEKLWKQIEPTTSKPSKRLETIRTLSRYGINVGVLLCPVLPGLTDDLPHLEEVVAASAEHGARFLSSQVLRLGPGISDYYLPFIERDYPKLMKSYQGLYRGNYAPQYYAETIKQRVDDLRSKYGLSWDRVPTTKAQPLKIHQQLDLFASVA